MITNEKAKALKADFPIFKNNPGLVYLDTAATSQRPQEVIDAEKKFYEEQNANIHRGVYQLSAQATEAYENAHATVAEFINADKEEIIITRNTTESINLLRYTLGTLAKGKHLVLTELEHHSNLVPWQEFAKEHNMQLKFIPIKEDYTLDLDAAAKLITKDTAIVAVNYVSNALGTINDVATLCKLGKSVGAIAVVDAAQAVPHKKVDVRSIGCDFLAFSGHKMCGPMGVGVLYGKKALLEEMPPFMTGGDMISEVSKENASWNKLPMKFEAGTPNVAGAIALANAINHLEKVGMENILAWEQELLSYVMEKLPERVTTYSAGPSKSCGILSFNIEGIHAHDVASLLDDKKIAVRGGHHCTMPLMEKLNIAGTVRASFYFYNTKEDVDALVEAIKHVQKVFEVKQ